MSDRDLKIDKTILRGAHLLVKNGLGDWTIGVNNKRAVLAETWHKEKKIAYSTHFLIIADKEQFDGITLHEATHALLGRGKGHGREFVRKCTEISPNATYARRSADVPIRKYILTCPECGYSGSNNQKKDACCAVCWKEGKTIKFNIRENILKVTVW